MKTWREIKQQFLEQFSPKWGERESKSIFQYVIEHLTNQSMTDIDLSETPTAAQLTEIDSITNRLFLDEPIQYITGKAWFDDMQFIVTPDVLIPRQETEELVYWIVNEHQKKPPTRILDIGTGSGCIAIALAKHFTYTEVIGWDVSERALQIANQNKELLNVSNVSFQQIDVLAIEKFKEEYDIVVSNPPYIPHGFAHKMKSQVTQHEPDLALFVEDGDPLLFYRKIAELVLSSRLSPLTSHLYYEINEFYKDQTVELLSSMGFNDVIVKQDLNGNWRMIKVLA